LIETTKFMTQNMGQVIVDVAFTVVIAL